MSTVKSRLDGRFTTVVAGAAVIALLGGGMSYAANTIGSSDIINGSVRSADVKDNSVKLRDISKRTQAKLRGQTGPAGPAGPAGPSTVTQVKNLSGQWTARSTDTAGLKMVGDGIQFGPFANGGGCANPGTEFARLDFNGLNGQTLNSLKSLVYRRGYTATNDTGGVGSPDCPGLLLRQRGACRQPADLLAQHPARR